MTRSIPTPRVVGPDTPTRAPAPRRPWQHRINRMLATLGFTLCLAAAVFAGTATSQTATAAVPTLGPETCDFIGDGNYYWDPEVPGGGFESLMIADDFVNEPQTPFESYSTRGTAWSYTSLWGGEGGEHRCSVLQPVQNSLANSAFSMSRLITGVTIAVRQNATDASPFLKGIRSIGGDARTTFTRWYTPAAVCMVILTGIWMVTKGVGGQNRSILSGALWVVIAIVLVTWLMLPTRLTQTSAGGRTEVERTDPNYYALTARANDLGNNMAGVITTALSPDATNTMCEVKTGRRRGPRTVDCVLWHEMLFKPWATGQFGGVGNHKMAWKAPTDNKAAAKALNEPKLGATGKSKPYAEKEVPKPGDDVRLMQLRAQAFSWEEASATGLPSATGNGNISVGGVDVAKGDATGGSGYTGSKDRIHHADRDDALEIAEDEYDPSTKNGLWNQVRAYTGQYQPGSYDTWSGQASSGDRLNTAMMTLFGDLLIAAFVISTSLLTLVWYAVVVMALMALPFVGMLSIYPPAQKFLRALLQIWLKGLILAVVFTIAQTMCVALTGSILSMDVAYGWKCLLLLAAVIALFKVAKMAREDAFTPNLNAQGLAEQMDPQSGVERVNPVLAGIGFSVGRAGARTVGAATGRATRSVGVGLGAAGTSIVERTKPLRTRTADGASTDPEKAGWEKAEKTSKHGTGRASAAPNSTGLAGVAPTPTTPTGARQGARAATTTPGAPSAPGAPATGRDAPSTRAAAGAPATGRDVPSTRAAAGDVPNGAGSRTGRATVHADRTGRAASTNGQPETPSGDRGRAAPGIDDRPRMSGQPRVQAPGGVDTETVARRAGQAARDGAQAERRKTTQKVAAAADSAKTSVQKAAVAGRQGDGRATGEADRANRPDPKPRVK